MSAKQKKFLAMSGVFAVGAVAAWALISGCGDESVVTTDPPAPPKPAALRFKEWETPAAVLVLSGEQHGYIEPCGCSETQSGGLARRADLIGQLNQLGWPVAGLDLGGSLKRNRLQSQLKFDTILKALETMRYSAMALGFEELNLGNRLFNSYQPRLNPQGQDVHPVLAGANVEFFGVPELGPVRSQILSVGDVKIGVTAVVGQSIRKKLFGDTETGDISIKPPAEILPKIVQELAGKQTDFNVLLSHASFEETQELLKQFPEFAICLCQTGGEEGREESKTVGNTKVIQVGWKGKYVGVLAYYPDEPKKKFQYELVELDNKNFENHQSIEPHLIAYQQQLKANLAAVFQDLKGVSGVEDTYVGAKTCGECHTKAYAKWKSSKHAHAYETLKTGREGQYSQPISRIYDPECLACHVTGWHAQEVTRFDSGFLPEELANQRGTPELFHALKGQQCENCHGPGSGHVEQERLYLKEGNKADREKLNAARRQMQLTKAAAKNHLCIKCHDYENSPKFDFDTYWDKIKHPWRD